MLITFGVVLILGTAGSSDMGLISFRETAIRSAIGLIMIAVGVIGQEVGGYGSGKKL